MKSSNNDMTRKIPSYGSGFDAVSRKSDPAAFLAWWNGHSFFPVTGREIDTLFSAPEMRQAA